MINCRALGVRLGEADILRRIDLAVAPGEVVALVGRNGCGKTTLLRCLAGLVGPVRGTASVGGRIGYMPQDSGDAIPLTVRQTVLLGRVQYLSLRLDPADLAACDHWIARLGLSDLAGRPLDTLSGGQRQMAFLAQTLIRDPACLLLDEPTSALDLANQLTFLDMVRDLSHARNLATVVTVHDLALAARVADRVAVMAKGAIIADGPPLQVLTPDMMLRAFDVPARLVTFADGPPALRLPGCDHSEAAHPFARSPGRA